MHKSGPEDYQSNRHIRKLPTPSGRPRTKFQHSGRASSVHCASPGAISASVSVVRTDRRLGNSLFPVGGVTKPGYLGTNDGVRIRQCTSSAKTPEGPMLNSLSEGRPSQHLAWEVSTTESLAVS